MTMLASRPARRSPHSPHSFRSRPVGSVGLLLLSAAIGTSGCGSNGTTDTGPGSADAAIETSAPTPTPDATTPIGDDSGGGGNDATPPPSSDAGSCGDGVVGGSEECDDGSANGTPTDGCTASCTFVCIQGDATRGNAACDDGNPCDGTETCQANHTCAPGTPLANGTGCGTGEICNNKLCAEAVCGDGFVTPPEECDDGSNNGAPTDGCTKACKFVCLSTDPTRNCTPSDPCQGQGTCNNTTHLCTAGTPEGNGTICSGGLDGGVPEAGADGGAIDVCKASTCVPGYCGDGGVVEPGEQCDLGSGNGAGTGCELDCTFSCVKSPSSCVTTGPLRRDEHVHDPRDGRRAEVRRRHAARERNSLRRGRRRRNHRNVSGRHLQVTAVRRRRRRER